MASSSATGTGSERPAVTQFASSPTGFLLIGNARTGPQADGASVLFKTHSPERTEMAADLLGGKVKARLGEISTPLGNESDWTIEALEANLKSYAEELGLGLGKLAQPHHAALTGHTTSTGIFDVLALLGREESLARIDAQVAG